MPSVSSKVIFAIGKAALVVFLLVGCTSGNEEGNVENTESSGLAKKAKKKRSSERSIEDVKIDVVEREEETKDPKNSSDEDFTF